MDAKFGEHISFEDIIKMFCDDRKKLDNISGQLHYREQYDTLYGIHDYSKNIKDMPMPEVAVHWAEDITIGNPLYESVSSFIENNIHKYTGLNYKEFTSMSSDMVRYITEKCIEKTEIEIRMQKELLDKSIAESNKGGILLPPNYRKNQ